MELTNPARRSPASDFLNRLAHWLVVSGIVAVILVVASLLSRPFVSEAMKAAGAPNSNSYESAAFADPTLVASGVAPRGTLELRFSGIPAAGAQWVAQWVGPTGARASASGTVRGAAGSTHDVAIAYGAAQPSTWLAITVHGFSVPLRVWIT